MYEKHQRIRLPIINIALLIVVIPFAAAPCADGSTCYYLPMIAKSGDGHDLAVTTLEVTQAIQDSDNSVPLVAGRLTVLRIYTRATGYTRPPANVKVQVRAGGLFLEVTTPTVTTSARGDYSSTVNVTLPASWLSGAYDLTVTLDPDNQLAETSEDNNSLTQRLTFVTVPPLTVVIVPIQYTHAPTGHTYPAPATDTVSDWITRTYPVSTVNITWHAPYEFTGDLSQTGDFYRLFNQITTLKALEAAPESVVYYGLIPTTDNGASWFYGGAAGLGWVGSRVAIGLDLYGRSSQIAAHEIGHNLGLLHAPCDGPAGTDPSYPYLNGSIGQFGLDVATGTVYTPEQAKDMMSYCSPKWISDYTYRELLDVMQVRQLSQGSKIRVTTGVDEVEY